MTTTPTIDQARVEAFVGKVLSDTSAFTTTLLAGIGDRLGLWKELASRGPATSAELAERAGINERYAREWLSAMTASGYLDHDATTGVFTLPAEHVPAVAQENGPVFFGGTWQMTRGMSTVFDDLIDAFRTGHGVPQSAYHADMWDGMERFTAGWFENHLVPTWIPAMPKVEAALRRGAQVADVGCGRGRGLISLAQAYPESTYMGYDAFAPTVAAAQANAAAAGLGDRIRFQQLDASTGLPGAYDIIFTFDVVHDAVDPRGLLRAIRTALNPDGTYVCLDINCSAHLHENTGPLGSLFLGCSTLYCMTTSLAGGGEALGTIGLHPAKLNELATEAGFGTVRRVDLENPFNNLYELRG